MDDATRIDAFIARWQGADGRERANYQLFLTELAALLELPAPEPASADDRANAYVFERRVGFRHGDGSESWGYIDLYRRGAFVLEAKDVKESNDQRYDQGMLRARSQAENYARALPADEGRPPFVVVVDVGRSIELYSEFSRSGATYTPFPDPRSHRIRLDDLRDAEIRERLRALWLEPLSLDPTRRSARVTREIAAHLAELARSLERAGHAPQASAGFLTRCLFTLFAEDVELIPKNAFRELLETLKDNTAQFQPMLGELWRAMDAGLVSVAIRADLLRFNGKLFKHPEVLPLDRAQIELLLKAAQADWHQVEPAIFGTLLERALDPDERHALGAHYTPRAYVERLVLPTVIEPLREDWNIAQAAALTLAAEGKADSALAEITAFHQRLCAVRVLDPACGSGNFLYVTLEHLKRLEGEVLNAFDELDPNRQAGKLRQAGLALDGDRADPFGGETVDPHQLLGIELNPRAAAIAELVLWIGYLQWHFRTRGKSLPPEPVLKDFRNIECRDAVLTWDEVSYATDERGVPLTRWDGKTLKPSPVTGEMIPDESARVPQERYANPRKAAWPQADFVIGNPPFIGTKRMKLALGDGYASALRMAWPDVPESSDFVMYWWHHAATLTARGALRRFGLITTNSLRQTFNRRVVEAALSPAVAVQATAGKRSVRATSAQQSTPTEGSTAKALGPGLRRDDATRSAPPISLVFAIPDHPWVDAADGAAVRIAMTVGATGTTQGRLLEVTAERPDENGEVAVQVRERGGLLHADLSLGADVSSAKALQANAGIAGMGVALHGSGFILDPDQAARIRSQGSVVVTPYVGGRDLLQVPRERYLIDFSELTESEARTANPAAFQHVIDFVKPERDHNNRKQLKEIWWRFGWERPQLRAALRGLPRYIGTTETSKHRVFQFIDNSTLPDHKIFCVASPDVFLLGILSSRPHVTWSDALGGRLGVGNDPVYNKTRCFDPFPFPAASEPQQARIRDLAEQLDAHRKRQQAAHPDLTLTGMYNVLEKLRSGEPLSVKERSIHEQGLVSVLRQLHDELDLAVLDAYGWSDLAAQLPGLTMAAADALHLSDREGSVDAPRGLIHPTKAKTAVVGWISAAHPPSPTQHDTAPLGGRFDETILERLVALNAERAAEEKRGHVRWLRPDFQNPNGQATAQQMAMDDATPAALAKGEKKLTWPKTLPEQVRAVADLIAASPMPLDADAIGTQFKASKTARERLRTILDTLIALGRVRRDAQGRYVGG